jgi:hypothetical protein
VEDLAVLLSGGGLNSVAFFTVMGRDGPAMTILFRFLPIGAGLGLRITPLDGLLLLARAVTSPASVARPTAPESTASSLMRSRCAGELQLRIA